MGWSVSVGAGLIREVVGSRHGCGGGEEMGAKCRHAAGRTGWMASMGGIR